MKRWALTLHVYQMRVEGGLAAGPEVDCAAVWRPAQRLRGTAEWALHPAAPSPTQHFIGPLPQELLRNPYALRMWLRYLDARKSASARKRYLLFERALAALPGSYKVRPRPGCGVVREGVLGATACSGCAGAASLNP